MGGNNSLKGLMMKNGILSENISETVRNKFNFTIDKLPLFGPDNIKTNVYGLFRSDNMELVGGRSVTGRYLPHQTDDVLAIVESAQGCFGGISKVDCYFNDGHYIAIEPSMTLEQRREVFEKDYVFPKFVVRAGYDGKSFRACLAWYRIACRNLATLSTVGEFSVAIRHTSGLRSKMADLISTFAGLEGKWDTLVNRMVAMKESKVNLLDFVVKVYGTPDETSKRGMTMHTNRLESIVSRINRERVALGLDPAGAEVTAWEAYNGIQGYVQHDATRRNDDGRIFNSMFDRAVIAAEMLALSA